MTEYIGYDGKGVYNQSAGSNTSTPNGDLYLGVNSGSTGTYNLTGGSLSAYSLYAGVPGTGVFNQSGANVTVNSILVLGEVAGSSGTYTMTGGTLNVGLFEYIGFGGSGTFTQSGGTHIGGFLNIGYGSNGSYKMSGGSLSARSEVIGRSGTGSFTQNGGSNTISQILNLGPNLGGSGTYTMTGGNLSVIGDEVIAFDGTGTFTQSSGSHTITGDLEVGRDSGSNGTFKMTSGSLTVGGDEDIGDSGTGVFTQTSGSNTVKGNFIVGDGSPSTGTYSMTSGSLSVQGANGEIIGRFGNGTFNQTSGSNTAQTITLAANSPTTYADTYSITSGSVTAPGGFTINGPYAPIGTSPPTSNLISSTGGNFLVNGGVTVNAPVTNNGLIKTTNAIVTWNGTVTDNSAYISDPATQTFVGNLNVTANGYLVGTSPLKPGPTALSPFSSQDVFVFKSDFLNTSIMNTAWNTNNAEMQFVAGASNTHELDITGGFVNKFSLYKTDNFGWFNLTIGSSQIIDLKDTNGQNNPYQPSTDGALYVNQVVGATPTSGAINALLTNIFNTSSDPIAIVYDPNDPLNQYLINAGNPHGQYIIPGINGGVNGYLSADPVPLPPSVLLLGSGLLGLGALGWRRKRLG